RPRPQGARGGGADDGGADGAGLEEPRGGARGRGLRARDGREDHRLPRRYGRLSGDERGVRQAVRYPQAGALHGAGGRLAEGSTDRDRRDRARGISSGAARAWWSDWSSKPAGARLSLGGFDSPTLPPRVAAVRRALAGGVPTGDVGAVLGNHSTVGGA